MSDVGRVVGCGSTLLTNRNGWRLVAFKHRISSERAFVSGVCLTTNYMKLELEIKGLLKKPKKLIKQNGPDKRKSYYGKF